ncbi:MAG: type II glyceraldehyde-3-phosphate dehydrogenase [Candidatus Micrarchaeota archaeon]|nr:type II glyceraldehyde-3-phosphate dehydrogenase [Candidatus Micrarchaeota archaeon]
MKVSVNGYGKLGMRVADAAAKHPNLKLVGVSKYTVNARAYLARERGIPIYAEKKRVDSFALAGIDVEGGIAEMVGESDLVIDASPPTKGLLNKQSLYVPMGRAAIFQGGENPQIAETSFNARSNFERAKGMKYVRVVNCSPTGICRLITPLVEEYGSACMSKVVVRPISASRADAPGTLGDDLKSILPYLPVQASDCPYPSEVHAYEVGMTFRWEIPEKEEIREIFRWEPRVAVLEKENSLQEMISKPNAFEFDLYATNLHLDTYSVSDHTVSIALSVPQMSCIVPENIDATMALCGTLDKAHSLKLTDEVLGINRIKKKMEEAFAC